MKIAILTPANCRSAIGEVSRRVIRELRNLEVEVRVIATDSEKLTDEQSIDFGCEILHWTDSPQVTRALDLADIVVYQIGDYFPYHEGGLVWIGRRPGMVCLHDFYLANLFNSWRSDNPSAATSILRRHYGIEAAELFSSLTRTDFLQETPEKTPMTEWVCSSATSVLTHSVWGLNRVLDSCPGPVATAPLPFLPEIYSLENTISRDPDEAKPIDSFTLLTFGNINPNKRVRELISAIGHNQVLRSSIRYRVVGEIQDNYRTELENHARELGVNVTFTGAVSKSVLHSEISNASMVSCLRNPTLEAASASAIESLGFGKAVLVSNHGFYAELPSNMVIKVDPENEARDLAVHLKKSLDNPDFLRDLGSRAATWASKVFSSEAYAKSLLDLAESDLKARPAQAALQRVFMGLKACSSNLDFASALNSGGELRIFEG